MRQRLINFAFAASVGLLVIFGVTWAATQLIGYTGVFAWHGRAILLDTCRGEISLWTASVVPSNELGSGEAHLDNTLYDRASAAIAQEWYQGTKMNKSGFFALGLGFARADQLMPPIANSLAPGTFGYGIVLPYWLLCAACAIWPVARSYRQHKLEVEQDRHLQGLCPKCGYDLRATPDRCPECGRTADFADSADSDSKSAPSA